MLRPRRSRFPHVAAAALAVQTMCACGRFGFDERRPEDSLPGDAGANLTMEGGAATWDAAGADAGALPSVDGGEGVLPTCTAGALICQGFEASMAGWTFVRSDGTATATTQDSRSGATALQLATRSAGATAYIERSFGAVSSGALYVRAFLKVAGSTPIDGYSFVMLDNGRRDGGVVVSLTDTTLALSAIKTGTAVPGTLGYPRDQWACVEASVSLPPANGVTVDLDGVRDVALRAEEDLPRGGYARVAIGIVESSSAQAPTQLLIDDVVIATQPIGCE